MTLLRNSCRGYQLGWQASTTAVPGDNAWDGVTIGGSGANILADDQYMVKGNYMWKLVAPSVLNNSRLLSWGGPSGGSLGAVLTEGWTRSYWVFKNRPDTGKYMSTIQHWVYAGGFCGGFFFDDATIPGFASTDASNSHAVGVTLISLNKLVRIETYIKCDPTTGIITWRWYNNPFDPIPNYTDQGILSPANTGSNFSSILIGVDGQDTSAVDTTCWVGGCAFSTLGWIGPEPSSFNGLIDQNAGLAVSLGR